MKNNDKFIFFFQFEYKYIFLIFIVVFLSGCVDKLPSYGCSRYGCTSTGGGSYTVFVLPTKNLTNKTIRFEITLESKDSEDYGTCSVFKKCKNMNYSFFVEKDYEIISGLQEGHYKL